MNFTINRKHFIDVLSIGGLMSGRAKTVPALEFAKITIKGLNVEVQSFDLENAMSYKGRVESCDDASSFLAPSQELVKALKTLNDDLVTIKVDDAILEIKHEKGTMTMPIYDASSFPQISKGDEATKNTYTVDSAKMYEWLTLAQNFASEDNFRPILNGVLIFVKGATMGVCATDAHKLYVDSVEIAKGFCELREVLPSTAIRPLLTIMEDEHTISMVVDNKNFTFTTSNATLTCRIVEGAFPNYDAIIPTTNNIFLSTNKAELSDSVKRVAMFANKTTSQIKLDIKANQVKIYGSDMDFSKQAIEKLNATHEGDDIDIGAKADYFHLCLSTISDDNVTITFGDKTRPMLFKDKVCPNKIVLLMPMLTN